MDEQEHTLRATVVCLECQENKVGSDLARWVSHRPRVTARHALQTRVLGGSASKRTGNRSQPAASAATRLTAGAVCRDNAVGVAQHLAGSQTVQHDAILGPRATARAARRWADWEMQVCARCVGTQSVATDFTAQRLFLLANRWSTACLCHPLPDATCCCCRHWEHLG